MAKAVFLDRDGTIVEDTGYLHERHKVRFLPWAGDAIALLNKHGYRVIVVSNQAGVARGYFTEETVRDLNCYIQDSLAAQGALIDRFYYCPHHTEGVVEEYRKACDCRKPNTGMIEQAARDFGIDLAASFMVGDQLSDIETGRRAGCRTVLVAGADGKPGAAEAKVMASHIAADLHAAAEWLLGLSTTPRP